MAVERTIRQSPGMDARLEVRASLERARRGTKELLAPLPDDTIAASGPAGRPSLARELAAIAYYEELWLVRRLADGRPARGRDIEMYERLRGMLAGGSEALPPEVARSYAEDVREQALRSLDRADLEGGSPLVRHGFVFALVLQHELGKQEEMLESLDLLSSPVSPLPPPAPTPERAPTGPDEIAIAGGAFLLGAVDEPWALDNELVPHEVELGPFLVERTPVSNGAFAQFVEDGGYLHEELWSPAGWAWRQTTNVEAPLSWERTADGWERSRFGRREPVPPEEAVQHLAFHEAEAFARWAGKRLPTEAEWERSAGWHEREGKRRYPWGGEWMGYEANLGHRSRSPAPVGSYPGGVSASGCLQLCGDVWEWTSSFFQPYPGFVTFPDAQCSEVLFGEEHRVLRGGSWATDPLVARTSFRRPSPADRRDRFAGLRCVRDA